MMEIPGPLPYVGNPPLSFRFGVLFFAGGVIPNPIDTLFQKVQPGIRAFEGIPCCLFATPDGERLFCGYTDGAVRVWDTVPWLERVARKR
jgi:hypothetical protein